MIARNAKVVKEVSAVNVNAMRVVMVDEDYWLSMVSVAKELRRKRNSHLLTDATERMASLILEA